MTSPRDPDAESGRWRDEEYPLIDRHPGYDRYPPPNTPARTPPPDDPDLPDFLARRAGRSRAARRGVPVPPDEPRGGTRSPGEPGGGMAPTQSSARQSSARRTPPGAGALPTTGASEPAAPDSGDLPPTARFAATDPDHPERTRAITSPGLQKPPRKLTVTRVAARRGIELTNRGFATFQRAAKADGAEESGLTALVYATMANFATDAAIAVALANTLFFASATAESKTKVALYLLITIAPFAVIAPLIGPMLDRLQRGRRIALASSFAIRVVVAVLLIFNYDTWALYPLALCMMILSKSFSVLKSAVTPRVLPPGIDLVRTNSRLTVFGLVGGTLVAGGVTGLIASVLHTPGALVFAAVLAGAGCYLSLRIPSWVEVTEGEVPATLGYHGGDARTEVLDPSQAAKIQPSKRRQPLGRAVVTGLWGNGTIRILTGFLTFYVAFVAKATEHRPVQQAAMLGVVGAAAAVGNFTGNATGARMKLGRPSLIVLSCTIACVAVAVLAALLGNLIGAAVAALVAAGASALAKVSLDASIQDDLPPESIASGFGRSETVLQLSWVLGGAAGVLLPTDYWKGFLVVTAIMALGLVQTVVSYRGHSLLPGLGGNRPQHAKQETSRTHGAGEPAT